MRIVAFHRYLSEDDSLRVEFDLERGKVIRFMVQLECRFDGASDWIPVLRYDTAHGFAHRDLLHPSRAEVKTELIVKDYNEALDIALRDLASNWHDYRRSYEQWLKQQ